MRPYQALGLSRDHEVRVGRRGRGRWRR
eukprot:COSAG04_NODE_28880_length_272_cov_1.774566_2_plen_27_part_01